MIKYISTRSNADSVTISEAVLKGLAPDGGLFIPEKIPAVNILYNNSYSKVASQVLAPYFEGDPLEADLAKICESAFDFPVPLHGGKAATLELYHGPTAAFKDFGARFLARAMEAILERQGRKVTILVATSGDTGSAVAAAFYGRKNIDVKVLFPKGLVSARQKKQLTCWGGNVQAYEVSGTFDDCQKMVKDAFMDKSLCEKFGLSSANSINLGRLLPQATYYAFASLKYYEETGEKPVIIVPSGNVGNCTAAYYAKIMGLPIEQVALAFNANKPIVDYLASGKYVPRHSIHTLANAMDVGAPSNIERLFALFTDCESFKANVEGWSVDDDTILKTIRETFETDNGYVICPHTACGERVRRDHFAGKPTIVAATAHPAKFDTIVEPVIGKPVEVPASLAELLAKKSDYRSTGTDYHEIF